MLLAHVQSLLAASKAAIEGGKSRGSLRHALLPAASFMFMFTLIKGIPYIEVWM